MVTIYVDGLCQPTNPGGYGCWAYVAIDEKGKEIARNFGCAGYGVGISNNVAEYTALIKALERAEKEGWINCLVKSDSQLIVNQTTGKWGCNQPHLLGLLKTAAALMKVVQPTITWIPREQNQRADHLTTVAYEQVRMHPGH